MKAISQAKAIEKDKLDVVVAQYYGGGEIDELKAVLSTLSAETLKSYDKNNAFHIETSVGLGLGDDQDQEYRIDTTTYRESDFPSKGSVQSVIASMGQNQAVDNALPLVDLVSKLDSSVKSGNADEAKSYAAQLVKRDVGISLGEFFESAVQKGDVKVAQALLDVDQTLANSMVAGMPALHYATAKGNVEMMTMLMAGGATVDARNISGDTPLMSAAAKGNMEAMTILMSKDANLHVVNNNGQTAVDMAAQHRKSDVLKALVSMGGKPTMTSEVDVNNMLSVLGAEPVKLTFGEELTAFFVGVFTPGTSWAEERTNAFAAKAEAVVTNVVATQEIKDIGEKIQAGIKELSNQRATPEINQAAQEAVKKEGIVENIRESQENIKPTDQHASNQTQDKGHGQGR